MEITLKEIFEKMKELKIKLEEDENADVEEIERELQELTEKRRILEEKEEKRNQLVSEIANGTKGIKVGELAMAIENRNVLDTEQLYRNAFLKNLLDVGLTDIEERAFTHTVENTGQVVPKELLNRIFSNMEEQHPLLKDVQVLRTGAVITIAKHTTINAGDAKQVSENEANDDEQNTFVNVSLSGKDFSKHVEFSYKLGKMSIPAFEDYLVNEISNRIGSAMAKDIYTQIKNDVNTKNKMNVAETGKLALKDITKAYGLLKTTSKANVYVTNETLWNGIANVEGADGRFAFIPNMQDDIQGQLIGKPIKVEDSVGKGEVLILAPTEFIYNIVQDIMIERAKDVKKHVHILSGFAIAEGVLTNDLAAVIITIGNIG